MLKIKNKINFRNFISNRYYTNSSKELSKDYVYTKYRISLPHINNVKYDDIYLSNPSKEDLYVFTKKNPVFLRFLKLITSIENRNNNFIDFAKRCESGLTIEKDIFLTKEELLELMFINGYSKKEINAFDLAFSNNYEFHYPEIAVLFQLDEEDTYKFCLKKRSEHPEKLFHLKFVKDKNLLSSYGLIFVFLYFGLNNVVLSNAWFLSKTIPFFSVFYMLASYFYKDIWAFLNKEKNIMIEQNVNNKLSAEDIIYKQLKLYSKDTECSSYLLNLKDYANKLIANYRKAYINEQKKKLQESLEKKLNEIYHSEVNYKNSLQNILLEEIIKKMYHNLNKDNQFYNSVLNDSINNIRDVNEKDTLVAHVKNELDSIKSLSKENPLIKNILFQYELRKEEYSNKYIIHKQELEKIKNIIASCEMNINKLNKNDYNDLLHLFHNINNRFGFYVNEEESEPIVPRDIESKKLVDDLNKYISYANKLVKEKKLVAFLKAFQ